MRANSQGEYRLTDVSHKLWLYHFSTRKIDDFLKLSPTDNLQSLTLIGSAKQWFEPHSIKPRLILGESVPIGSKLELPHRNYWSVNSATCFANTISDRCPSNLQFAPAASDLQITTHKISRKNPMLYFKKIQKNRGKF